MLAHGNRLVVPYRSIRRSGASHLAETGHGGELHNIVSTVTQLSGSDYAIGENGGWRACGLGW